MALTAKQEKFCQEYMISLNATSAAIAASYSEKTAYSIGHENLSKPEIKARLKELRDKEIEELENSGRLTFLKEIYRNATTDMADYINIEEGGGITAKAFKDMPKGATRAIRKIRSKRTIKELEGGQEILVNDDLDFELHSKDKALEMMGKYLKLFEPDNKITNIVPVVVLQEDGQTIAKLTTQDNPT